MAEAETISILLIDDDPDEHFLFRADLEDAGVELDLCCFSNPNAAVRHMKSDVDRRFLVLTDLSMPGIDPAETVAEVFPLLGGGAVGVFSGTENPEMEEACRTAGAGFYIVKPVTRKKIEKLVSELDGMSLDQTGNNRVRIIRD